MKRLSFELYKVKSFYFIPSVLLRYRYNSQPQTKIELFFYFINVHLEICYLLRNE